MKIAVFFIIVGIGSCFADGEQTRNCKLQMDYSQAHGMLKSVMNMADHYDEIRYSGNECEIWCNWNLILYTHDVLAAITGCTYMNMIGLVMTCVPERYKNQTSKILDACEKRDIKWLTSLDVPSNDFDYTFSCMITKMLSEDGYNPQEAEGLNGYHTGGVNGDPSSPSG